MGQSIVYKYTPPVYEGTKTFSSEWAAAPSGFGFRRKWLFLEEVKKDWMISTGASCWPFILIGVITNFPHQQGQGQQGFAELIQQYYRTPEG